MTLLRMAAIWLSLICVAFSGTACDYTGDEDGMVAGNQRANGGNVAEVAAVDADAGVAEKIAVPARPPVGTAAERVKAVGKMAIDRDKANLAVLRASLNDDEPLVRRHAIFGLQRLGDLESVPAIGKIALTDPDAKVRRSAAASLGRMPCAASGKALMAVVEAKDDDAYVQAEALLALGRLGDKSTQGAIVKALDDERLWLELDMWTQVPLIRIVSLPFWDDESVKPLLKRLMASRDWERVKLAAVTPEVRHERALLVAGSAAEALAVQFGDASGEDLLIEGLGKDDYMQQRSARALAAIKSKKAVPALIKLLGSQWTTNRLLAVKALGASGDRAAVEPLVKLADGNHPRLRRAAFEALGELGVKVRIATPPIEEAKIPEIAEADLKTPGGKRPPMFIALGVDDCANLDGIEAMLDIVETLHDHGQKVCFTLWVAPLAGDPTARDTEKQVLILQRLFDLGSEIAHHTLRHNPGGVFWTARDKQGQIEEIEGCTQWYRDNIDGFVRPFTHKGGGGASIHKAVDMDFSRQLMARQNFIYRGRRIRHANDFQWPAKEGPYTIDVPLIDGSAPPVKAATDDGFFSDYPGSFDYEMDEGLKMYMANFEYRYNHPRRPIMAVNAFHDWGFQLYGHPTHRNQAALLKAFLMEVLVHNREKYPDVHCVTFRQVVEYAASEGDLDHTLKAGNCQDSRNEVKPLLD